MWSNGQTSTQETAHRPSEHRGGGNNGRDRGCDDDHDDDRDGDHDEDDDDDHDEDDD